MGAVMGRLFTAQNPGSFGGTTQNLQAAGAPSLAPAGLGQAQSLLQFRGKGDDPQMITATIFAISPPSLAPTGPLTGILFWGSGNGQNQRAEFDIGVTGNADDASLSGGTMVSVPATHLELQVRNDGNLIPVGGSNTIGSTGGPVSVIASLGVGAKISNTRAVRTAWLINGGAGLAPGATIQAFVPPFATSFVVQRDDAGNALQIDTSMNSGLTFTDGPYNVAANARSPEFSISGWVSLVRIKNTGATPITNLSILFFLSF